MITDLMHIKGFSYHGFSSGLKEDHQLDLVIIHSDHPSEAACLVKKIKNSEPLEIVERQFENHKIQTVVINSSNSNTNTGELGTQSVHKEIQRAALTFQANEAHVAALNTGAIKENFPITEVLNGISFAMGQLKSTSESSDTTARALADDGISVKGYSAQMMLDKEVIRFGAIAQHITNQKIPIGTIVKVILTDLNIEGQILQDILNDIAFNDDSTQKKSNVNEVMMILASSKAKHKKITQKTGDIFDQAREKIRELYHMLLYHT
jgi:N-acetylglutamate synthase/N-acetylornithine aminotransferase